MEKKVLVAYASRYGATAGIAKKIGEVLNRAGLQADVIPVSQVKDLFPYGAVVLGSAVYILKWRKEAARFLKAYQGELANRDVWLFSSGPTEEGENPLELLEGWTFPKALQPIADEIKPRDITVFHGALYPEKLNFFYKWIINNMNASTGDYRDWDAITFWAESIVTVLNESEYEEKEE